MNKGFLAVLGLVVLGLVGIFVLGSDSQQTNLPDLYEDPTQIDYSIDYVQGTEEEAVVELIEYGDLQCPACATYHPLVTQLKEDFGSDLAFAFRHFPLAIHGNAQEAHIAAEAAGQQGKFFEMENIMYTRQTQWAQNTDVYEIFDQYAEEIGLDMDRYRQDVIDEVGKQRINQMVASGNELGVNSTPTFLLNGEKITNPQTYEEFKSLIQAAIDEANSENQ